jgi:hypothetical protein
MKGQSGKITFMNLVVFVILVFGAFMAFKYIANGVEKKQIKIEVHDTLGSTRGGEADNAQLEAEIGSILSKRKIEILEISVNVDKGIIHYSFSYKIETDYVLFKHSEVVEVVDELANYGG